MEKNCALGYRVPTIEERTKMKVGYFKITEFMYSVPSKSVPGKRYLVDLSLGRCSCEVGMDGSPCPHQYFLWVEGLDSSITNLFPIFSAADRKFFAHIACGSSLPIQFYEPLHSSINQSTQSSADASTFEPPVHEAEFNLVRLRNNFFYFIRYFVSIMLAFFVYYLECLSLLFADFLIFISITSFSKHSRMNLITNLILTDFRSN